MVYNQENLASYLLFDTPIQYNEQITLYPVKMKDILVFNQCYPSITVRKDAIFNMKQIIKMGYLDFIKHCYGNVELLEGIDEKIINELNLGMLPFYYNLVISLLVIVCGDGAEVLYDTETLDIYVNQCEITNEIFDDIRRIIIIQNDIDFDVDEFMNIETLMAFKKAKRHEDKKKKEKYDMEDYIDSMVIALRVTNDYVSNLTVRKFWRYIKRIIKQEDYIACHNGEMGGMVTFKEPIRHWMSSMEVEDKYENLKSDEEELKGKIG